MKSFYELETYRQKHLVITWKNIFHQYELKGLSRKKTCFKSTSNPNSADLFLTKKNMLFSKFLSDFYELSLIV